ncbi:large ribosomal subunit protein P2A-like [Phragmites australis]|uniref:large ribosomal subunit protein P2A-like n=1 Tax=Phragmites australis TaxID=29695 RepID=UPI002D7A02D1|nr:large ribosomal subunit protein P2A-like [Phragmites australis]
MKFVAAYLLACLGADAEEGAPRPGKGDVRRILDSVGAEVEEGRLDLLFAQLEGKDVAELLAAGREMLAYAPCGSGAAAVAVPAAACAADATEAKEEKKEEEKVESEEEDDAMFSLFD